MRAILTTTLALGLMAIVACSDPPPPPPPPAEPMATAPEPEKINAENADAASDALEKEIAADAD